jgi:hypothetical protein
MSLTSLSGKWHNQHGSEVDLIVSENGRVAGKFYSGTGLAKGEACELNGFATRTLIAFTVDFSRYDSLTSWAGHLVAERDTVVIHATWNMSVASFKANDPEILWKGTWTGSDTFRRGPSLEPRVAGGHQPSHPIFPHRRSG